jgi:hypothetical protein
MPVFLRTLADPHVSALDAQVVIRARDVDAPAPDRLPVSRLPGRQRARAPQDLGQQRLVVRRHVHDDEDRRRQVGRQVAGQLLEDVDTAGGGPDDDDVVVGRLAFHRRLGPAW